MTSWPRLDVYTDSSVVERCEWCGGKIHTHFDKGFYKSKNDEQFFHELCYIKYEQSLRGCGGGDDL